MVLDQLDPDPIIYTPPGTVIAESVDGHDAVDGAKISSSSVPWPESTFIIRSVATGHLLTLRDGGVVLAQPGGRGSIHWACVEAKGWFGFRNLVSGRFLGHDKHGRLSCSAERHQGWENFCVRLTPEGGYLLLMTHFERLWNVGVTMDRGVEKLAKVGNKNDAIIWEFIKI